MSQHSVDSLMDDLRAAIAEVEGLIESTAAGAGEQAAEVKAKAEHTLHDAKQRLASAQAAISHQARRSVRDADRYVHDKPWQAIGIAAGVAFVVGLLVGRR
jgi:hypothetical protein